MKSIGETDELPIAVWARRRVETNDKWRELVEREFGACYFVQCPRLMLAKSGRTFSVFSEEAESLRARC